MSDIVEGPVWDEGVDISSFPSLAETIDADVVIIGAGITGVTAAYLLAKEGQKVVLLEKDRIGQGATGLTTAFLTQYLDTQIGDLQSMFGEKKAAAVLASHARAIDIVEEIVQREQIECEFMRCSNFIYARTEDERAVLQSEQQAGQQVGVDMELRVDDQLPFKQMGYLELPRQAKFHPRQYVAGLIHILQQQGVQIFEQTEVTGIEAGSPAVVTAGDHQVRVPHVIVATYAPFNRKLFFKKAFYTSYILEAIVPSGRIPEGIYEDLADPYHYFRIDRLSDHDRMIFGGADHRSDIHVSAEKSFASLEDTLQQLLEDIPHEIVRRWHGPIVEPVDGLASIGPLEHENIFYATGFSGNGMTYGIVAARLMAGLVQGKSTEWLALYDARRTPTARQLLYKGRDYTQELFGGAVKNTLKY